LQQRERQRAQRLTGAVAEQGTATTLRGILFFARLALSFNGNPE
jgi:hypothetical protein